MDKLKEEKEQEIAQYVASIDGLKEEIGNLRFQYERQTGRKGEIEEEKKEVAENLKQIQK